VTTTTEKFVVIFGLLLISGTIKSCFVGVLETSKACFVSVTDKSEKFFIGVMDPVPSKMILFKHNAWRMTHKMHIAKAEKLCQNERKIILLKQS
jgi:hypothetical protein